MTLYEILGVAKDATIVDIRNAYRKLAKQHHPDKQGGNKEMFQRINKAYTVLSNAVRRKHYDETGQDDEIRDKADAELLKLLGEVFDKIAYPAIDNDTAKQTDIPKEILKVLGEIKDQYSNMKKKNDKFKDGLVDALARILKRPERDIVTEIAEARIALIDQKNLEIDSKLGIVKTAIGALQGYQYRTDPKKKSENIEKTLTIHMLDEAMIRSMFKGSGFSSRGKKPFFFDDEWEQEKD